MNWIKSKLFDLLIWILDQLIKAVFRDRDLGKKTPPS